jgi:hypothetical protein
MKEEICQFTVIKVNVPQVLIRRCFYSYNLLTVKEKAKISQKMTQIEQAEGQLAHLRSIVEKVLLKG